VRVGWASTGAQGLLIAALQRSGGETLAAIAVQLAARLPRAADRRRLRGHGAGLQVASG